jgi:mRNA interferase HigB
MHVISRRALREFWERHPPAKLPLAAWFRVFETTGFANFTALKRIFRSADYLAPYTIFDVGGNKYRVIAVIHYNRQRVYVRHVFTHSEYDEWSEDMRRSNRSKRS